MRLPSFTGEGYVGQTVLASPARTVNLMPERIQTQSPKGLSVVLYQAPGLAGFATAADTPGRGMFAHKGRAFALIGARFFELESAGTLTVRGTVTLDGNPVCFDTNGDIGGQLGISSAGQVYIYDLDTNAFSNPTSGATMLVFMDGGRFVRLDATTSTLGISNIANGLVWDPTQTTQRSTAADPWVAMALMDSKELLVLGEKTGDIYYNSGASPFPYQPRQGILITPGIAARWSLKKLHGSLIWLANSDEGSGQVVRAVGYNPQPISNHALDHAVAGYKKTSRIDDAVAFTYEIDGHFLYELNFPSAGATWVWDETTGWWHERGKYDKTTGEYLAWGPQYHCSAFGHHLVADHRSGTIYRLATDEYLDTDGDPLRRLRIVPWPFQERKLIFLDKFRLYLDTGVANQRGQGSNPQVFLRTSLDGGKTYGPERWRSAGAVGNYKAVLDWFQLGSAYDGALSLAMTDPTPWRILDGFMEAHAGNR